MTLSFAGLFQAPVFDLSENKLFDFASHADFIRKRLDVIKSIFANGLTELFIIKEPA